MMERNTCCDIDNLVLNIVDDQLVEEGFGQLVSFGVLSAVLSVAGIVEGAQFNQNMARLAARKTQGNTLTITKSDLKNIVKLSEKKDASEMLGSWQKTQVQNIVARTLWMEARGEGIQGLKMVMSVIWNRAEGKPENLAPECLKKSQFSCWDDISGKTTNTYKIEFPVGALNGSGKDSTTWELCQSLARQAVNGTFKPVNSSWNAYYNPKTVKAKPSWDKDLTGTSMVGHHKVGSLKWYKTTGKQVAANTYTVKSGDSLWGIAKNNGLKVDQLKKLNGLTDNTINPGQILKLA